jgi:hypothetical protein
MTIKDEEKLVEETQPASTLPGYKSKYTGQINEIYNKIANREPFSYDVNDDALYQNMKDQYIRGGQMAMMDTMGQAQAMTGGYGNSYAQSAGQNAYQNYLTGLNEQVPELYQLALNNYLNQGDQMAQQYSMLLDQEATDYNRYQDQMALVQPQVLAMLDNGQMPSDEMLAASGLSPEYIKALYGYIGGGAVGGGGGGSGSGSGSGGGNDETLTLEEILALGGEGQPKEKEPEEEPQDGNAYQSNKFTNPTVTQYTATGAAQRKVPTVGQAPIVTNNPFDPNRFKWITG